MLWAEDPGPGDWGSVACGCGSTCTSVPGQPQGGDSGWLFVERVDHLLLQHNPETADRSSNAGVEEGGSLHSKHSIFSPGRKPVQSPTLSVRCHTPPGRSVAGAAHSARSAWLWGQSSTGCRMVLMTRSSADPQGRHKQGQHGQHHTDHLGRGHKQPVHLTGEDTLCGAMKPTWSRS